MKKICLLLIIVFFTTQFAQAFSIKQKIKNLKNHKKTKKQEITLQSSWKKIDDSIYIDVNSLKKKKGTSTALFKVYTLQNFGYQQKEYKAYCKKNTLEITGIENFDRNGNFLSKEKIPGKLRSDVKGVVAGEIYFNALCN